MEFPDERAKRKRAIRLFTGYFLIAVIIALASVILVYLAQGYGYDTQKGVMRNGLVFIESKPVPTAIYLDNISKGDTGARLVLNEGTHTLKLAKDKYREWSKEFTLEGGSVQYFLYPRLFPTDITVGVTRVFNEPPVWASQSPDRHWLVMQSQKASPVLTIVDLTKPSEEPKIYTIPADQFAYQNGEIGSLAAAEWSDDNKHLLLTQTFADGQMSYIIFDRENSDESVNVSNRLGLQTTQKVVLFDKKYDKYYVHDAATGELKTAELKKGLAETALLTGVVYFKPYADDLVTYVTYDGAKATDAKVMVLSGKSDKYMLKSLPRAADNKYLLDMAKYQSNWYYVTASTTDKKVNIYRNPLSRTKPGNTTPLAPQMMLSLDHPQFVSFSDNARFIAMQSGKSFVVYDNEQVKVFRYSSPLNIQPTQQAKWMDGHRMTVVTDSKVKVFEFDGANMQILTSSRPEYTAYFNRDYTYLFTLMAQADGKTGFESGKLTAD